MGLLGGTAVAIPQIGEEYIPHGLYVAICRLGYGADTTPQDGLNRWTDTQEVIPLFDINSTGVMVHSVTWDVETAFTASVTITLGDTEVAAGFVAAAQLAATIISTGAAFDDTSASAAYAVGRRYLTTDAIDATVAAANPVVGLLNVYCVYSYAPEYPSPDTGGSSNT
jgi:hypothetical protein